MNLEERGFNMRLFQAKMFCGLALLMFLSCLSGGEISFAENGKAQCLIALPDKPTGFERNAADDLSSQRKPQINYSRKLLSSP